MADYHKNSQELTAGDAISYTGYIYRDCMRIGTKIAADRLY